MDTSHCGQQINRIDSFLSRSSIQIPETIKTCCDSCWNKSRALPGRPFAWHKRRAPELKQGILSRLLPFRMLKKLLPALYILVHRPWQPDVHSNIPQSRENTPFCAPQRLNLCCNRQWIRTSGVCTQEDSMIFAGFHFSSLTIQKSEASLVNWKKLNLLPCMDLPEPTAFQVAAVRCTTHWSCSPLEKPCKGCLTLLASWSYFRQLLENDHFPPKHCHQRRPSLVVLPVD